ncbi:hypothetical protein [Novosphingobium sp. KA1]|uniref:hypothetical protein n=1 Tax=Novosphingobium sp. (strain KA1) TaxID=164608 RepID=UPI001A8E2269|nr:hypothetical protein [Novosphingobium sp. KA1]QSR17452.1 hypothetical protein CA833_09695 [Novosphingobium sp. KA1]
MSAPEILLPRLRRALANLVAACDAVSDGPINEAGQTAEQALRTVMRRLLLSETLGGYSLLAIAGTQGAGKTTLIKTLYDLKGEDAAWLNPNEGRGETHPILITESDDDGPVRGFVWRLKEDNGRRIVERVSLLEEEGSLERAQAAFQDAACNSATSALLVELSFPARLGLGKHKGWLLLPGYETQTAGNLVWQSTMRAALSGATGAIVVTDATRLARDQGDLARDAFGHGLEHVEPLVVISKTEALRDRPEDLADLQARGAEAFNVSAQRVQCIGIADDQAYLDGWREALKDKINQFVAGNAEDWQGRWHADMSSLLRHDLKLVLSDLNRHLRLMFVVRDDAGAATDMVKSGLEIFDEARDKLRRAYGKSVRGAVDAHRGSAEETLKERLKTDFEGLANHAKSFFDTDTERLDKLEKAIADAEKAADEEKDKVGPLVVAALEEPIRKALRLPSSRLGQKQASEPSFTDAPAGEQLPAVTTWSEAGDPTQSGTLSHALATLFSLEREAGAEGRLKLLDDAIRMLPALTLDFSLDLMRELKDGAGSTNHDAVSNPDVLRSVLNNAAPAADNARGLVRTVAAAIFSVGVAEVGEAVVEGGGEPDGGGGASPSTAATAAKAAAMMPDPVIAGAVAVVAAGFLAVETINDARMHDRANRVAALNRLRALSDARHQCYMEAFDDAMGAMRDELDRVLSRRYGLAEAWVKKDRAVHALAIVQNLREEFSDALDSEGSDSSPRGLRLTHA